MTSVRRAVVAIMNPVILNQVRLVDRTAPGSETRKVTKVITPAAMTPRERGCQPSIYMVSRKIDIPVKGVCISSMLAATLSMVGSLAIAAFVMKTTPISRPPEARNKKSWSRKTSKILLTIVLRRALAQPQEACRSGRLAVLVKLWGEGFESKVDAGVSWKMSDSKERNASKYERRALNEMSRQEPRELRTWSDDYAA